ncbi:WAP four-disulfide core domain protein 13 [Trichechus inunguis]
MKLLFLQLLLLFCLALQLVPGKVKQRRKSRCWLWAQGRGIASVDRRGPEDQFHFPVTTPVRSQGQEDSFLGVGSLNVTPIAVVGSLFYLFCVPEYIFDPPPCKSAPESCTQVCVHHEDCQIGLECCSSFCGIVCSRNKKSMSKRLPVN